MNRHVFCVLTGHRQTNVTRIVMPEVIDIEDEVGHVTMPEETTMVKALSPLLTSMKLFGMYFKCCRNLSDIPKTKKRHVRWNMIYPAAIVILLWINALRMFSVFTRTL